MAGFHRRVELDNNYLNCIRNFGTLDSLADTTDCNRFSAFFIHFRIYRHLPQTRSLNSFHPFLFTYCLLITLLHLDRGNSCFPFG